MQGKTVGFAMCGSYCSIGGALSALKSLIAAGYSVIPILSESAASTETRFGRAGELIETLEGLTGNSVIKTITSAEPIGPRKLLDALIIDPCTGTTLSRLANGLADTAVSLACKAHVRNGRPVVVGVSTNDALSGNAQNIGKLLSRKYFFFVPFRQDDPYGKPCSMIADHSLVPETLEAALGGRQLQPLVLGSAAAR